MIVSKQIIKDMELKHRRRFRALAKYHYNAGYEVQEHHEREDTWNMHQKERYRLPETPQKPFYPGIDKVNLPYHVANMLRFTKDVKKAGHFNQ